MRNHFKRGSRLVAVAALSAAVIVGLAGPASAAPPPGQNQALGIVTTGLIAAGPFAAAQFNAGPFTSTLVDVDVPGLLGSGTVNADAGPTTASASVEDLGVTLSGLVSLIATAVSSECSYDAATQNLSGSSSLAGAAIDLGLGDLVPDIALAVNPAPNTAISVPGVATIVLNRQVINPDGSLTVDAIFIDLLSGTQTVTIATSSCQPAVLVIPAIAAPFAVGAGVLGLMGLGLFLYRRRETAAGIAQA